MGITHDSLNLLEGLHVLKPGVKMLELGCQELFLGQTPRPYAAAMFRKRGMSVRSVDISGCGGAETANIEESLGDCAYDLVTDFGTLEHVDDIYLGIKSAHEACRMGGMIIHRNPLVGHWEPHGSHWFTMEFWAALSRMCKDSCQMLETRAACGNPKTGMEVLAVIIRGLNEFPSRFDFSRVWRSTRCKTLYAR